MISSTCNSPLLAGVLVIVKRIITLIGIIAPIALIIWATIGFIDLMKNPDEDKKNLKKVINKFLAAVVVFMIPYMINAVMLMVGDNEITICWKKPESKISASTEYSNVDDKPKKSIITNSSDYEKGEPKSKIKEKNAKEIPNEVIKEAKYSDLSITISDDSGNVLAKRKPDVLREGGSTTKVFTGFAAVKLLDPKSDVVVCTKYAQSMPYIGDSDVSVGQKLSVIKAATKDFPGSSNVTTANIAIAIGKKYYNPQSDEEAYKKGMDKINEFLKKAGCTKTKLVSSSGVNYNYNEDRWGEFDSNGISQGEYGITSNDLALVTMEAMKDENFSTGISGKNNNGLFFIKSGTQAFKHGVWGFNHNGKRYYIVALGFNFKKEGDLRETISKNLYNYAVNTLIK